MAYSASSIALRSRLVPRPSEIQLLTLNHHLFLDVSETTLESSFLFISVYDSQLLLVNFPSHSFLSCSEFILFAEISGNVVVLCCHQRYNIRLWLSTKPRLVNMPANARTTRTKARLTMDALKGSLLCIVRDDCVSSLMHTMKREQ